MTFYPAGRYPTVAAWSECFSGPWPPSCQAERVGGTKLHPTGFTVSLRDLFSCGPVRLLALDAYCCRLNP